MDFLPKRKSRTKWGKMDEYTISLIRIHQKSKNIGVINIKVYRYWYTFFKILIGWGCPVRTQCHNCRNNISPKSGEHRKNIYSILWTVGCKIAVSSNMADRGWISIKRELEASDIIVIITWNYVCYCEKTRLSTNWKNTP